MRQVWCGIPRGVKKCPQGSDVLRRNYISVDAKMSLLEENATSAT
jgi:hypothetical protein